MAGALARAALWAWGSGGRTRPAGCRRCQAPRTEPNSQVCDGYATSGCRLFVDAAQPVVALRVHLGLMPAFRYCLSSQPVMAHSIGERDAETSPRMPVTTVFSLDHRRDELLLCAFQACGVLALGDVALIAALAGVQQRLSHRQVPAMGGDHRDSLRRLVLPVGKVFEACRAQPFRRLAFGVVKDQSAVVAQEPPGKGEQHVHARGIRLPDVAEVDPYHTPSVCGHAVTLTVYDDFRCTVCAAVDAELGPAIRAMAASGRVRVLYVVGASSDATFGGSGAAQAANAAACAQAAGLFAPYRAALYRAQPPQNDDAFADRSRLLAIADSVPGLRSHTFDTCALLGPAARPRRQRGRTHHAAHRDPPRSRPRGARPQPPHLVGTGPRSRLR